MKIIIDSHPFYIRLTRRKSAGKIPIVFLHGFTGSSKDWEFILNQLPKKFFPAAIDLIGHGKTASPENVKYYSTKRIVSQINTIINKLNFDKIILAGYSMGGRAALSYANSYPRKIQGLILESSSPGIQNDDKRNERIKNDLKLAEIVKNYGVAEFINHWTELPLFQTLKAISKNQYEGIIEGKKKNNVWGLSNSLKGFSTGRMPDYWSRLKEFDFKTLLITGELDRKFTQINSRMNKLIPHCSHKVVKRCGHNVHLEKPEEFIILVKEFLRNFSS